MNERGRQCHLLSLCHDALRFKRHQMRCEACGTAYRIQTRVPVFVQEPLAVVSVDHRQIRIGADFEVILRDGSN